MAPKVGQVEGFDAVELKTPLRTQIVEQGFSARLSREIGRGFGETSYPFDGLNPLYLLKYAVSG